MSRRKQPNPKPIKRKSDSELLELSELHSLPTDSLSLQETEDGSYGIFSSTALSAGTRFGPFHATRLNEDITHPTPDVIKLPDGVTEGGQISVQIPTGSWIRFIRRPPVSQKTNSAILLQGDKKIWCELTENIETCSELLATVKMSEPCSPATDSPVPLANSTTPHSSMQHSPRSSSDCKRSPSPAEADIDVEGTDEEKSNDADERQEPPASSPKGPVYPLIYMCVRCGVKYSNPSTLEAHMNFYCSVKTLQPPFPLLPSPPAKTPPIDVVKTSPISYHQTTPLCSPEMKIKASPVKRTSSDSDNGDHSPAPKIPKMSHFLKCQQCTYSTNQLTDLEQHMMQHSPGSVPHSPTPGSSSGVETMGHNADFMYCSECNIQFSSLKTYQGHKEFYCEKRHRKANSSSGRALDQTSPRSTNSNDPIDAIQWSQGPPPTSVVVTTPPAVAPIIMPYPLPCHFPLAPCSKSVVNGSNEDKPLDLSVKKPEADMVRKKENPNIRPSAVLGSLNKQSDSSARKQLSSEHSPRRSHPNQVTPKLKSEKDPPKKCLSCNIEFSTHEVYLIHKQQYCSHRDSVLNTASEKATMVSPTNLKPEYFLPISSHNSIPLIPQLMPQAYMRYFCAHCNIKFSSKDTLSAHLQFYCPMKNETQSNGQQTPSPKSTDNHTITSPKSPKRFSCEHCGAIFYSAELLGNHIKHCRPSLASFSLFNCPYCKFISYSEHQLMDHIKCHMATKYYSCRVCGYRGNTLRGMKMHGKVHAENDERFNFEYDVEEIETDPKQENNSKSGNSSDTEETDVDMFINFVNLKEKYKHLILSPPLLNGLPLPQPSPHICFMCHDTFSDMTKLRDHMRVHSAEEPCKKYVCKYCDVGCAGKTDLVRHVKVAHETRSRKNSHENGDMHIQGEKHEQNTPVAEVTPEKKEEKREIIEDKEEGEITKSKPKKYESKENEEALSVKDDKMSETLDVEEKAVLHSSPIQIVKPLSIRPIAPLSPVTDNVSVDTAQNNILLMKTDKNSPQYCKQCDITFMYYSTFIAHKKYYCASHISEKNVA